MNKKESKKSKSALADRVTPTCLIKRQYDDSMKQTLMDNMYNYLLTRGAWPQGNESGEMIGKIVLNIAEKLIDKNPAKHFVGVQPMQGPIGLIYCLQYNYNENVGSDETHKMNLEVNSKTVEAKTRKFQNVSCTIEAMNDLESTTDNIHKFAEKVLDKLATDMATWLYRDLKSNLLKTAFKETDTINTVSTDNNIDPKLAGTRVAVMINKVANEIGSRTRRGCGNFIIASEAICNIIQFNEDDAAFTKAPEEEYKESDYGFIKLVGTLNGTIKVFCDYEMPADKALVGYKGGNGETDAGFFYCPYVPVMSTGILINPKTFEPTINFMTRYGEVEIRETALDTTENEDGSSTEIINKASSNYYAELTINNAKEISEIISKMEKKNHKVENIDVEESEFNAFCDALKLLD